MSVADPRRAWRVTTVLVAALLAFWVFIIWLAHRDSRPAIQLTNLCFAAGLVASYAVVWAVAAEWRSRRRVALRAIATTMLLVIIVGILELPALLGLVDYSCQWNRLTGDWRGPESSFVADPNLGFSRRPHQSWSGQPRSDMAVTWNLPIRSPRKLTFSTDHLGFRNRHDRDHAHLVVIGDSYIEGAYASDDETMAVVLEQLSGKSVTNLGRAGYGTLQELEVLARFAIPQKPRRIAWFFYEGNDLYNDQDFEEAVEYLRAHGSYVPDKRWTVDWHEFRDASFTRNLFLLLRRVTHPIVPNGVATYGWFSDASGRDHRLLFYDDASVSFDNFEQQRFEKTQDAFRRGKALCDENGIELWVLVIPTKFRVYRDECEFPAGSPCLEWQPWDVPSRLEQFCESQQIRFLDLTHSMRRAAATGVVLYAPEDSHWTPEGHAFVAQELWQAWSRDELKQEKSNAR